MPPKSSSGTRTSRLPLPNRSTFWPKRLPVPGFGSSNSTLVPLLTADAWIRMYFGSSRKVPATPCGALASGGAPPNSVSSLPETSIKPPLPPLAPPRACATPENLLVPSAHATTLPPSPSTRAMASNRLALLTVTLRAFGTLVSSPPWPPPMRNVPPPASPLAKTRAAAKPSSRPLMVTLPPTPLLALASMVPDVNRLPVPAGSALTDKPMSPPRNTPWAETVALALWIRRASACSEILPPSVAEPSALMAPSCTR